MLQSSKLQRCGDEAAKKHCGLKLSLQWCTQLASSFGKGFFFSTVEDLNLLVRIEAHF